MQTKARIIQLTTNSPAILLAAFSEGSCVVIKTFYRTRSFKHLLKMQIIVVKPSPDVVRVTMLACEGACGNSVCAIIAWEKSWTICVVSLANSSRGQISMWLLSVTRKIFPYWLQYCICSNFNLNWNIFFDVIFTFQDQFDITLFMVCLFSWLF